MTEEKSNDKKSTKFVANSPITAWKMATDAEGKNNTRIVGASLFGLSNKKVKEKLIEMEQDYKKEHPEAENELNDFASQGSDTEEQKNSVKHNSNNFNEGSRGFTLSFMTPLNIVDFVIPVTVFDREMVHEANMDEVVDTNVD